jgi:hypothetical protein
MKVSSTAQFSQNKITVQSLEVVILIILLSVFLLIGLVQASRLTSFSNWQDQILFVDPAINLYFDNGFTSSAWFAQTKNEFFAGYPPLYSFLIYLWIRMVGFGVYTAHSLNCFLTVACAVILWKSVIRLSIITSAKGRIYLIILVLIQLAYISNRENGRPDILMTCLSITCLLVYSIEIVWLRHILLMFFCSLFPLAGLALIPYSVLLCALLLVYLRRPLLRDCIFIAIGLLTGSIALYALYSMNGVLDSFFSSVRNNPTLVWYSERDKISGVSDNLILQFLMAACFFLVIRKVIKGQFSWFSKLSFGAISMLWIPVGMRLGGAFHISYSWMLFIPLAICVSASLDEIFKNSLDGRVKLAALSFFLILVLSYYTNITNLALNWKLSDYSLVESFVQKNLRGNEWVYSDSVTYFPAKRGGRIVIGRLYLDAILTEEKEKISALLIRQEDLKLLQDKLGGKWYKHGESLILTKRFLGHGEASVGLGIYRRE